VFFAEEGIDSSFVIEVVQGLVVALGAAFFLGNLVALLHSRAAMSRYDIELAKWKKLKKQHRKKGEKPPEKPEEPQQVNGFVAIVQMAIGIGIVIVGVAGLTMDWL